MENVERPNIYTSRLQKGGALLEVMRALCLAWEEGKGDPLQLALHVASLPGRHRAQDVIRRTFVPRLVDSNPADLWRTAAALERASADRSIVVPLHYYLTADSEPLLWDFVADELFPLAGSGQEVNTARMVRFIDSKPDECFGGRRWTPTVTTKVARGVLAALRDYGVLVGASKKKLSSLYLPVESFALLCRIRYDLGHRGEAVLGDPVWKLFFLAQNAVDRFLLEATARRLLRYETAGPVVRIEFPVMSLEEYAEFTVR